MAQKPGVSVSESRRGRIVRLLGAWAADFAADLENTACHVETLIFSGSVVFELSSIEDLDTLGALLINRCRFTLEQRGLVVEVEGVSKATRVLLDEIPYHAPPALVSTPSPSAIDIVADMGESVVSAGKDLAIGTGFLGQVAATIGSFFLKPGKIRVTSIVAQVEQVAFRGVPIIALISFLVGAIVAQQGIFQLSRFGASPYAVNLIGILVLRELGVLLTSIMIAGRSGSAFTAELGSMTMREEVDALRVMGLDPIAILVVPRVIALIVGLPLLTFISDMSALFGGAVVSFIYGGMSFEIYVDRLKDAIALQTFLAGLIKAPFMALVIALVACGDGLSVRGSAESLGRQVTDAVVKSIFMVIVVDGLFAMFFAAIRF
jgi:phospholipid/cholesterol/gamma-HCH transport system permease protein